MTAGSATADRDDALGGLARGSSLNIAGAICQQACMLLITALIARVLGSDALGRYSIVYALLTILGLAALCGFRAALTRFVATQLADRDDNAVRGTIRLCVGLSVGGSVIIGGALLAVAGPASGMFHDAGLRSGIECVALALPAATIRDSALAATQGWRSQRSFTLIGWVCEPMVRLVLTAVLIWRGFGIDGAFAALLVGSWLAAAAAWVALRRRMRSLASGRRVYRLRGLLTFSLVSWVTTLASTGLIWADTLLLGHFAGAAAVGVYTVATRLVTLAVFVMAPINAAFAPRFAHHFHLGETDAMARTYAASTAWILRLSLPSFVMLVAFPAELLMLFGSGYAGGLTITVVLAVGQFINALTGPCGTAINMTGRVWLNMINNVLVLAANVGLNLWLIPVHGAAGAAVAWSISLGAVNLGRLIEAFALIRSWPFDRGTMKALVAGLASWGTATLIAFCVGGWTARLIVGALAAGASYVVVTFWLGLEPQEKAVYLALRRRSRLG